MKSLFTENEILLITADSRKMENALHLVNVTIAGITLCPGERTTLSGLFKKQLYYVGRNTKGSFLFLKLSSFDLFVPAFEYIPVQVFTEDRLYFFTQCGWVKGVVYSDGNWKIESQSNNDKGDE